MGEVGCPVGMTVNLVSFDVVEYARPGGTVAVPGVLKIGNLVRGEWFMRATRPRSLAVRKPRVVLSPSRLHHVS